ncbi:MAG: ATP-binding protein [Gemmatimonadota bacterium]|nr:ATP-binding protein [Gemmatimonadota bacterium]MDE2870627.1 ATP-binding protein [Gemmatimonadota bacterium]
MPELPSSAATPRPLADLIAPGEGQATEFERGKVSGLGREICAFANSEGGVILLGVDDDGTVVGIGRHNRVKSQV